jgi:hypothetical protein
MSQTVVPDDKTLCANPACEAVLSTRETRCPRCQEAQLYCRACGATARALARFCRCCANVLRSDFALEHPGIRFRPPRQLTGNVGNKLKLAWQLPIESEMVAAPLAARGLVILTIAGGHIVILDEIDGRVRGELAATPPLSFTPVIVDNMLIVATGDGITAFDLIAALYGNVARGGLKLWQYPLSKEKQVIKPLLSITDTIVALIQQGNSAQLLLLDKRTGAERTIVPLPGRGGKISAPYLKEKDLFIAARDGTIMQIDLARAAISATARAHREIDINVFHCGFVTKTLFVLADGQLWSASKSPEQGKLQLQSFGDTGGLIVNALAATERHLAVAHGSGLAIYDQAGRMEWETGLDANSMVTPPLLEGNSAWAIDDTGILFYFDLSASVPRLRQRIFEHSAALPAVLTEDHLVFANRAGLVKVFYWRE